MTTTQIDTIVIGAGQAGLNTSRALQMTNVDHVVFERGRIGESWLTQRWDSFRMNTPTWSNGLLGFDHEGVDPDGFMSADEFRVGMQAFVDRFELPIREQTSVTAVRRHGEGFEVETSRDEVWAARNVVICSGAQNVPRTPALADRITGVTQMHAAEYRNPDALPAGGVLVVGSAQTGGQIAEELVRSGRTTYLCTSNVGSVPRRHRGRDMADWLLDIGLVHAPVAGLEDPADKYNTQPMISGANGGHSVSIHSLAHAGVTALGGLRDADGTVLTIGDDLTTHAATGLAQLNDVRSNVDQFIAAAGIEAAPATPDEAMTQFERLDDMAAIREIDLADEEISTVIWATGFTGNFSYLGFDVGFDDHGVPIHDDGISVVDGIYFCGFPWMRIQSSGLIYGSAIDAKVIAEHIQTANSTRTWGADAIA